jgi:hypothetical protein
MVEVMEFLARHDYFPFDFGGNYRDAGILVSQDVWFCRLGSPLSDTLWKGRLTRRGPLSQSSASRPPVGRVSHANVLADFERN